MTGKGLGVAVIALCALVATLLAGPTFQQVMSFSGTGHAKS